MKRWLLWACATATIGTCLLVACKGEDKARTEASVCERAYSVCPAVQPISSDDITACAQLTDGRCGTTMRRYIQCATGKCDDAGLIDVSAIDSECGLILNAYRTCSESDAGTATGTTGRPTDEPITPPAQDAGFDAF